MQFVAQTRDVITELVRRNKVVDEVRVEEVNIGSVHVNRIASVDVTRVTSTAYSDRFSAAFDGPDWSRQATGSKSGNQGVIQ